MSEILPEYLGAGTRFPAEYLAMRFSAVQVNLKKLRKTLSISPEKRNTCVSSERNTPCKLEVYHRKTGKHEVLRQNRRRTSGVAIGKARHLRFAAENLRCGLRKNGAREVCRGVLEVYLQKKQHTSRLPRKTSRLSQEKTENLRYSARKHDILHVCRGKPEVYRRKKQET